MSTLDMIWPITGRRLRLAQAGEAIADDLLEEALQHGVGLSGWPVVSRTEHHLAASAPVMRESGDGPPWESRRAWADADLDIDETPGLLDRVIAERSGPIALVELEAAA